MITLPSDLVHSPAAESVRRALEAAGLGDAVVASAEDTVELHSLNNQIRLALDPLSGERYVIRIPNLETALSLGIRRSEERDALYAAAAAGVTPPVLAYTDDGVLVSPRLVERRRLSGSELASAAGRREVAGLVGRLQAIEDLPTGAPTTYDRIRRMIDGAERAGSPVAGVAGLLDRLADIESERAADARYPPCLVHHDLWGNNLLDDGQRFWLLDFEFAGVGDGWYDLASVSQEADLSDADRVDLLRSVGREGDARDLAAIRQGEWLIGLFEACWATIMAAYEVQTPHGDGEFDYSAHATAMLARLG